MSVAILGGLDRLKPFYLKQGRKLGFSNVKVYSRKFPNMIKRLQGFGGIVICRKGRGVEETFTVRRIASGVGVERVFPVHSPLIEKVEVDRESVTMRARMYYLRDRVGKEATKVKEKRLMERGGK